MPRFLLLALLAALLAAPAHAAEEGGEGGEGGAKKPQSTDVTGGRFAGDPVYVHLAPMILPVITNDGAEQLVTLQIDVEVKDFDVADDLHTNMPRVMDALMRHLYGGIGRGALRNGKMIDVVRVKSKATAALDEIISPDGIKDVLIQGVAQRML